LVHRHVIYHQKLKLRENLSSMKYFKFLSTKNCSFLFSIIPAEELIKKSFPIPNILDILLNYRKIFLFTQHEP